jgi:hypothetical protein
MAEFHKGAEASDPFEAMAVLVDCPPGYDGVAAMARAFVEEYAMLGWGRERIMKLFRDPRYAGTHAVYHERGEAFVQGLLDDVLGVAPLEGVRHA